MTHYQTPLITKKYIFVYAYTVLTCHSLVNYTHYLEYIYTIILF